MMAVFSEHTASLARGIADHDRDGHIAGIVGGALDECLPDRWCGRTSYDRRNISTQGLGEMDSHAQMQSMTPGRVLPHSAPVLCQALGRVGVIPGPGRNEYIPDFGCECGSLLIYVANYLRCRGVGFEVEPSRAAVARSLTAAVHEAWPAHPPRVSIIEADFLTFPAAARVQAATIAIISDLKFDSRIVTTLMDALIMHCPWLMTIVKVQVLSVAHSAHFHSPVAVQLECSWSSNPVAFLLCRCHDARPDP